MRLTVTTAISMLLSSLFVSVLFQFSDIVCFLMQDWLDVERRKDFRNGRELQHVLVKACSS